MVQQRGKWFYNFLELGNGAQLQNKGWEFDAFAASGVGCEGISRWFLPLLVVSMTLTCFLGKCFPFQRCEYLKCWKNRRKRLKRRLRQTEKRKRKNKCHDEKRPHLTCFAARQVGRARKARAKTRHRLLGQKLRFSSSIGWTVKVRILPRDGMEWTKPLPYGKTLNPQTETETFFTGRSVEKWGEDVNMTDVNMFTILLIYFKNHSRCFVEVRLGAPQLTEEDRKPNCWMVQNNSCLTWTSIRWWWQNRYPSERTQPFRGME